MDYEKKYESVMDRLQDLIANAKKQGHIIIRIEDIENAIPELQESEDKRVIEWIRKELESKYVVENRVTNVYADEALSWLEKQGEHENEEKADFTIYHPLKNGKGEYECIPYSFYGTLTSFSESSDLIKFLSNCFNTEEECEEWIKKQDEKKHKFIIGDIISNNNAIYRVDNIVKNCIGQDCYFLVNVKSEMDGTRYLKLIDSNGKTHNSGEITWLCEQVDAKFEKQSKIKSAWSEEDRDLMYNTLSNLTELKDLYGNDYGKVGKCIDWLKSLKKRITSM